MNSDLLKTVLLVLFGMTIATGHAFPQEILLPGGAIEPAVTPSSQTVSPAVTPQESVVVSGTLIFPKSPDVTLKVETTVVGMGSDLIPTVIVRRVERNWLSVWIANSKREAWIKRQDALDADEAVAFYSERLAENGTNEHAIFWRSHAFLARGELEQALADANSLLALSGSARSYWNRGLIQLEMESFSEAIADFQKAVELDPKNAQYLCSLGMARLANGETEMAMRDFDQALVLDSRHVQTLARRGDAWLAEGEFEKAIGDYTQAMKVDRNDDELYRHRAVAYDATGDLELAIADYTKAIEFAPNNGVNYQYRGETLVNQGKLDAALADFDKAHELLPTSIDVLIDRSNLHLAKKEIALAIDDLTTALKIDDHDDRVYLLRGQAYIAANQLDEAITDLNRALELNAENLEAFEQRIHAWELQGNFEKVLLAYQELLAADANSIVVLNALSWLRATCPQDSVRNAKSAIELANQACLLTEWKDANSLDTLATAYAEAGDFPKAIEYSEKAIALAEDVDKAAFQLRLELFKSGKPFREPAPARE